MSDHLNKHSEDVPRYLWRERISDNQINDCPVGKEPPVFPAYALTSFSNFIFPFVNVCSLLRGKIELLLYLFLDGFQLNCDLPSLIFGEWRVANVSPRYVNDKLSVALHFCPKVRKSKGLLDLIRPRQDLYQHAI